MDKPQVDAQEAFLANPIVSMLRQHNSGHSADLLGRSLQDLIRQVKKYRKVGKLAVKLSVDVADEPDAEGNTLVDVQIDYEVKAPTESIPKRVMYTTDSNTLSNDNPNQLRIEGI